jgi:hypothetical protein
LGPIGPVVSEEIIFKLFFAKFSIFRNGGYLGWWPLLKIENLAKNNLKIISYETAG